jgi:hypothetical protein
MDSDEQQIRALIEGWVTSTVTEGRRQE